MLTPKSRWPMMTMLAVAENRADVRLTPKYCQRCKRQLGECSDSEFFVAGLVFVTHVIFICNRQTGGCGATNHWIPLCQKSK